MQKKSNIHTAWKYAFLLPLFLLLMSMFNEPVAQTQSITQNRQDLSGGWSATVEKDRLAVSFEHKLVPADSFTTAFYLKEITGFATGKQIDFSVVREAGTVYFKGSLVEGKGRGTYRFVPAASFLNEMKKENLAVSTEEQINFFLTNVTLSYVQILKKSGYPHLKKPELERLAEQGLGKKEAAHMADEPAPPPMDENPLGNLINFKSVGITEAYIKSFEQAGYRNITPGTLINFKSVGVTPEYIKSFYDAGFTTITYETFINFKSVGVTPDYIKSFQQSGYPDVSYGTIVNLKAAGIPPPGK